MLKDAVGKYLVCKTPRQATDLAVGFAKEYLNESPQHKVDILLADHALYAPLLASKLALAGLSFNSHGQSTSLVDTWLWQQWWTLYQLLSSERPLRIQLMRQLLYTPLFAQTFSDEQIWQLAQRLNQQVWHVDSRHCIQAMQELVPENRLLQSFFDFAQQHQWNITDNKQRRLLLEWLVSHLDSVDATALQTLEAFFEGDFVDDHELVRKVRQTTIADPDDQIPPLSVRLFSAAETFTWPRCLQVLLLGDSGHVSISKVGEFQASANTLQIGSLSNMHGEALESLAIENGWQPENCGATEEKIKPIGDSAAIDEQPSSLSVSALSQFALCPYRYFAAYGLGLRAREVGNSWRLPHLKIGELAHAFFEIQLAPERDQEGHQDSKEILEALLQEYLPAGLKTVFHEQQWQSLVQKLITALDSELELLNKHRAKVKATETAFEFLMDDLTIRGRIDRIDELPGGKLVIVDYKTSGGTIGPKDRQQMSELIKPQLPIYLLALQRQRQDQVAAAIEVRLRSNQRGGIADKSLAVLYKSASYLKLAAKDMQPSFEEKLKAMLTRLCSGEVAAQPASTDHCGLGRCDYWHLCRIESHQQDETNN